MPNAQHRFGNMAAEVLNSTAVLRLNFCAKLNICASISATSPSRKTLAVILFERIENQYLMKKLKIFYPKNSIKIKKPTIIMLSLIALIFLIHFSKKIFPENFENLDLLSFAVIVLTFFYFVFYLIYINFSHETENGNYCGYLIIENDKITCDKKTYLINEIEKISILEFYYRGKFNGKTMALEPKRSNGLKNYIEISSKNKVDKYYFLQTKNENIKMFKNELKIYYEKGLIGKQNFENIMN